MNLSDKHKYDDIINLPHPVSKRHPPMSLLNRAAQFSPFAALAGHSEAVQEAARLTDPFKELSEDRKERLDEQIRRIRETPEGEAEVEVTYFQPDERKDGGAYVTVCGRVKRIDEYGRRMIFTDGTALLIDSLFSIEGELFRDM